MGAEEGTQTHLRSDNGLEFVAEPLRSRLREVGVEPMRIMPGSAWESPENERFNGTLRQEVFDAERIASTRQAQIAIDM